jgi:5'-nucleotidase/UDP-sugar diphosphatase
MRKMRVISLLFAMSIAGCVTPPESVDPVRVTILHTNDHHGRFWKNADDEYGLAARKTLIDRIRAEVRAQGGHTLLLDGGDVNTGIPESDLQNAEPDFRGMSLLGYDAMAVGNHEFDKPAPVMQRQRAEWSNFPWLSANVYQNGARLFEPYRIFAAGPVRIAVLGLTTDDTAKMLGNVRYPGVSFRSPIEEARQLVPQLRRKADVVIAATHMGHYTDGKHGVSAPGDVELARAVAGLDLVVGGHTHTMLCMLQENVRNDAYEPGGPCAPDRQNGAWIVQAGEWGKFLGRADFEYSKGEFRLVRYRLLPVNPKQKIRDADGNASDMPYAERIAEDSRALSLLRPYQDFGSSRLSLEVGRAIGEFDGGRPNVRTRPSNLGVLITAAMIEKTHADLALVSGGGIRDSLPAGRLTYRDILRVHPFANQIVTVSMRGSELVRYFEAVARMTPGSGAFPQYSGARMTTVGGQLKQLVVNGQAVESDKMYRIALNSFVAKGGDGYPDLSSHPGLVNTGFNDAEVLREFIARRGVIKGEDFRPD